MFFVAIQPETLPAAASNLSGIADDVPALTATPFARTPPYTKRRASTRSDSRAVSSAMETIADLYAATDAANSAAIN
jgi:hypothetical protein